MSTNVFGSEGWNPDRIGSLEGKTILITGANSGTGYEATKIFLQKGANIIMLNRNEEKTHTAIKNLNKQINSQLNLSFIKMDLSDLSSIRKAGDEINKTIDKIDVLICNAAVAQISKQEFTKDGFESQLGINYYGHFLLVNLLFHNLDQSKGRVVVVGSEGYKMGLKTIQFDDMNWNKNYNPMNTYCHSKLAQMMFAYELQDRIKAKDKKVKVFVCHPGASRTSLINDKASKFDRVLFSIMSLLPIVQSAEKGSYPEVMCSVEDNLKQKSYYGPTGTMQWIGPVGECKLDLLAQNKETSSKLWDFTKNILDVKWDL